MSAKSPEVKHTPGPWCTGEKTPYVHAENGREIVFGLHMTRGAELPEQLANARLIAAAPELLEVVKKAMLDLEDCMEHSSHLPEQVRTNATASIEQARAIIAKAEGHHV